MHITLCPSVLIKSMRNLDSNSANLILRINSRTDTFKLDINLDILEEYQNQLINTQWDPIVVDCFLKTLTRWLEKWIDNVVTHPRISVTYSDFQELVLLFLSAHPYIEWVIEDINDYNWRATTWVKLTESWTLLSRICSSSSNNFFAPVNWVQISPVSSTQNNTP